jgi:hypothetical protein
MTVRESLTFNRDLITGKLKEIAKYKLKDYPMRGVFSVELFDALTGKKTYEAKSENRINPVYANAAYLDAFCGRILNNYVDDVVTNANGTTSNPCRCMLLTDGTYNKTIDIASFTYSYISLSRLKAKGKIFVKVGDSSGTVVVLNESYLSVMLSTAGNIGSFTNSATFENYNYYLRWDDDTQLFIRINTTTGILYVSYLFPAFAHTLLASSVTKTSTNTI